MKFTSYSSMYDYHAPTRQSYSMGGDCLYLNSGYQSIKGEQISGYLNLELNPEALCAIHLFSPNRFLDSYTGSRHDHQKHIQKTSTWHYICWYCILIYCITPLCSVMQKRIHYPYNKQVSSYHENSQLGVHRSAQYEFTEKIQRELSISYTTWDLLWYWSLNIGQSRPHTFLLGCQCS